MRFHSLLASVALLLAASCGGGGAFDGTVAGHQLAVKEVLYGLAPDGKSVVIALFDREGMCEAFESKTLVGGSKSFAIYVKPEAKTHVLGGPMGAHDFDAVFTALDETCVGDPSLSRQAARAVSGTVTLDAIEMVTDGKAKGQFDLMIGPQGDNVRGDFSARWCSALGTNFGERPACRR